MHGWVFKDIHFVANHPLKLNNTINAFLIETFYIFFIKYLWTTKVSPTSIIL